MMSENREGNKRVFGLPVLKELATACHRDSCAFPLPTWLFFFVSFLFFLFARTFTLKIFDLPTFIQDITALITHSHHHTEVVVLEEHGSRGEKT